MADRISARLTAGEGRRFGLTVGGAFLVLALILTWRGRSRGAMVFFALGGLLLASALLIPASLGPVRSAWMRLARAISRVTTPIVMGIAYFAIISPIGFAMRALGRNRLWRQRRPESAWVDVRRDAPGDMRRQF